MFVPFTAASASACGLHGACDSPAWGGGRGAGSNLARRAWLPLPPTGHLCLGPRPLGLALVGLPSRHQPQGPAVPDLAPAYRQGRREEPWLRVPPTGAAGASPSGPRGPAVWGSPAPQHRGRSLSCSLLLKVEKGLIFPSPCPWKPLLPHALHPRSTAGAQRRSPEAALASGKVPPPPALAHAPSAVRLAVGTSEGAWLGVRLRASGRASTRDRWRRAEQRQASHSPRGFPELWRAPGAHVAGPQPLQRGSLVGHLCGLPSWPGWAPGPCQPSPRNQGTVLVPPSGSSCVLVDGTLHLREMRPETANCSALPHVSTDAEVCQRRLGPPKDVTHESKSVL